MKLRILTLVMMGAMAVMAADQPVAGKHKQKKAAPAKPVVKAPPPLTIPDGAVEVSPYTYSYTDPSGKKWIYRKTPFGVGRVEDKPVSPEAAKKAEDEKTRTIEATTAVEDGDSIRFERATPFGPQQWVRKKTELNEIERAAWDREREKRAARESAENTGKD
ncbi:MAG TPA: hypothetical protein VEU62_24190 [Bryobacterales bacterium]|nr:hypothetical protein [Bryobacterales bacterium]